MFELLKKILDEQKEQTKALKEQNKLLQETNKLLAGLSTSLGPAVGETIQFAPPTPVPETEAAFQPEA